MNEREEVKNPLDDIASSGAIPTPEQVLAEEQRASMMLKTLSSVKKLIPEEEDESVLFKNNWIARGQSIALVASTGVGKSSMTMQTALHWALGKYFLAQPMRPIKCSIIQAEDSERDVAEQIEGMRIGLVGGRTRTGDEVEGSGWTEKEFDEAVSKVLCPTHFIGLQGDAFIKALREYQQYTNCDMIFINPVQAFFGGDVSSQEDVSHWCRAGIDSILKDESHPCSAFMVMHTTKFTSGDDKGRANVDDYAEYIGCGSHEWTDWVRAKFVFLKHKGSDQYVDFVAAKRGARLKWTSNGFPTKKKFFMQSHGYIYWNEVEENEVIRECASTNGDANEVASRIAADLKSNGACKISEIETRFKDFSNRATIRIARDIIKNNPQKFRLTVKQFLIGKKWTTFVGLSDSLNEVSKIASQQAEVDYIVSQQTHNTIETTSTNNDYEPEMPF